MYYCIVPFKIAGERWEKIKGLKTICCALGLGLFVSEAISFCYIQQSNAMLYAVVTALTDSGHTLLVPNRHVLPLLNENLPAVYGAFFIVLTAGVTVSIFSILSALLVSLFIRDRWLFLGFYAGSWMVLTIILNAKAFCWIYAAHTLLIPGFTWLVLKPRHPLIIQKMTIKKTGITIVFLFVIAFSIIGSLVAAKADQGLFLRARDYLLLSNRPGRAVNYFYYRYTLYAAESIRSPFQKQVKACWISPDLKQQEQVKALLFKNGWLHVNGRENATLVLEEDRNRGLDFYFKDTLILSAGNGDFLRTPERFLVTFSNRTDPNDGFRFLCLIGLVAGLPFLVFFIGFSAFFYFFHCLWGFLPAVFISPVVAATASFFIFSQLFPLGMDTDSLHLKQLLTAPDAVTRVEALRILDRTREPIRHYPGSVERLMNGTDAEKYWLAKNFASNPNPKNIIHLKQLIRDESINVQCAAIQALSMNRCPDELTALYKDLIQNHPQWYVQQYAYNAFRKCP